MVWAIGVIRVSRDIGVIRVCYYCYLGVWGIKAPGLGFGVAINTRDLKKKIYIYIYIYLFIYLKKARI